MLPKRLPASLLAFAALVLAAVPALAAPARPAEKLGPAVLVVATPQGGHVIGRPGAPLKLVEYVSYTCPHCAAFEKDGADTIGLTIVRPGKGSVEYRPLLRNIIDVAATLLVGCGNPAKFPGNHAAVLRGQEKWFLPPSSAQQQRWSTGDFASRMRAIAGDMYLYPIFEARGYDRVELDRCLANEALAKVIAAENKQAMAQLKLEGTPSFLIDGVLQPAHDWATLRTALAAATK
jgi:protein-disulfide isomerase